PAAVYHGGALVTEDAQRLRNRQDQLRAVNANQRQRRVRRVNEWTEHIKQRPGFKLLANGHRVAETGVILRRKQETDAQVIQSFTGTLGVHVQVDTESRQQVGRSGTAGHAAVAVL